MDIFYTCVSTYICVHVYIHTQIRKMIKEISLYMKSTNKINTKYNSNSRYQIN